MSSMLSAPATIPATRAPILTSAFAPAEPGTLTCSATGSPRPARWAKAMTGTNPAQDTRFASTGCSCCSAEWNLRKSHSRWSQGHPCVTTHPGDLPHRRIQAQSDLTAMSSTSVEIIS